LSLKYRAFLWSPKFTRLNSVSNFLLRESIYLPKEGFNFAHSRPSLLSD
jgi:hypothetical protein